MSNSGRSGQETPTRGGAAPNSSSADVSRLRLAVLRLARRLRQNAGKELAPSQQSLVVVLDRFGDMTLGELANREGIQPPSVTRMIDALEVAGLVRRYQVEGNRRSVYVGLTDDGRLAATRTHRERDEWLAARLAGLDEDEIHKLFHALPALEKMLEDDAAP